MSAEEEITEVFEIVDRLTGRRAVEIMFTSAFDAFRFLETNPIPHREERKYLVQSVSMWEGARP